MLRAFLNLCTSFPELAREYRSSKLHVLAACDVQHGRVDKQAVVLIRIMHRGKKKKCAKADKRLTQAMIKRV